MARRARRLGLKTVPTSFVYLSQEQARLLNLALNKMSGEWDEQLLARLLADLHAVPTVYAGSDDELQRYLKRLEAEDKRDRL